MTMPIYWTIVAVLGVTLLSAQATRAQDRPLSRDERDRLLSEASDQARKLNELQSRGKFREALEPAKRMLAIAQRIVGEEHALTASTYNNVGVLLNDLSDYPAARTYYEKSLAIRRKVLGEEHADTAMSYNDLGVLLYSLGDYPAARTYYEKSLAIRRKVLGEEHADTAMSYNDLGVLFKQLGDYSAARTYYEKSLAIRRKVLGEEHADTAASYNNLGNLLRQLGDHPGARAYYEKSLAIKRKVLGEEHADTAMSYNNLGVLLNDLGDYPAARTYYEKSLAIKRKVLGEEHAATASSYNNLMVLEAEGGDLTAAAKWRDLERRGSRRQLARLLPTLSEEEQAQFLGVDFQHYSELGTSLGLLAMNQPAIVEQSANWLINGKGVAQEALAERTLLLRDAKDEKRAPYVAELTKVREQLARMSLQVPESGKANERREKINAMAAREIDLARQLAAAGGPVQVGDPWVELETVRKSLPADSLLIEWIRFRPYPLSEKDKKKHKFQLAHYAASLIPPAGDVRLVDLGEAQPIDALVEKLRSQLTEPPKEGTKDRDTADKALQDVSTQLSQKIWQPLAAHVGDTKQLVISPDGGLWLVPWSALPLDDDTFLIEKYALRYVTSGRDLVRQGQAQKQRPPVIVADPDFDLVPGKVQEAAKAVLRATFKNDDKTEASSSRSLLSRAKPLPGTAVEAAAIKPSIEKLTGKPPAEYKRQYALESIAKALTAPQVAVFSTHGFFLPDQEVERKDDDLLVARADDRKRSVVTTTEGKPLENPLLRCGLLFAGCNPRNEGQAGSSDDGVLTGMEIVGIDFRGTDLVVLSACDTGIGKVNTGEGVAGLRQAFQLAGANAVVATLWQIPDEESVTLMNAFFAKLADGKSKAEALQYAQRLLIQQARNNGEYPHPYYWAAYTLTGK